MNLHSGFEDSPTAFYVATSVGVGSMTGSSSPFRLCDLSSLPLASAIMVIGWIRLLRARKSQVFLGSALREQQTQLSRIKEGRELGSGRM